MTAHSASSGFHYETNILHSASALNPRIQVEAKDLNDAIRVASKHPAAHLGEHVGWGIEIRPIEFFQQS